MAFRQSRRFQADHILAGKGRGSLTCLMMLLVLLQMNFGCSSSKEQSPTVDQSQVSTADTFHHNPKTNLDLLVGRWLRPDGGYILEIRSATADGRLDVGYFNPKPINVGRAEWVEKDGKLYVMAELQDVNYPGSTYGLEYIAAKDQFAGTYFQAVEKSTYDVQFVREK